MEKTDDFVFEELRALDDEVSFFSRMGRFFASTTVRRECGGYPINDGPRHLWFVVSQRHENRILGFISIEQKTDVVQLRDAYIRTDARNKGLFRELRQRVLAHIDAINMPATVQVPRSCAPLFEPYGFEIQSTRGFWVKLRRNINATGSKSE